MSFRFCVLGSGSGGNATLVEGAGARVLVDAGLSAKQLTLRLEALGVEAEALDGVLLSHEHGDHTRGLEVFCRRHGVPVFCNRHTQRVLAEQLRRPPEWKLIEAGGAFMIGGLRVTTFGVPHDAVDPMGFTFHGNGCGLGVVTDLGHVDKLVRHRLEGVEALVIEANYDDVLLEADTRRPWPTKQRIASQHGHLSNAQAAELAAELAASGLRRVVLAHLSRDCNSPEHAVRAVRAAVPDPAFEVCCAAQDRAVGFFELTGAGASPSAAAAEAEDAANPPPMMVQGLLWEVSGRP